MKLSFAQKLWLPLILSLLCLAGISIYDADQTRAVRLGERKADLTHASGLASNVVKSFGDQVAAGSMSDAEARWLVVIQLTVKQDTIRRPPTVPLVDGRFHTRMS